MTADARVTFLGTGTSHGVPMIGCRCPTCVSTDPRDQRWRPSIVIRTADGLSVLVDAAPDLRSQALRFGVERVDAILFTHGHADHVMGLDEVRRYNVLQDGVVPCYGDRRTIREVRRTFAYVFRPVPEGGGIPRLALFPLGGPFSLGRSEFIPVPVFHGRQLILGYRLGRFAYLTDCSGIPDASWPLLEGVRVLVLNALRDRPHPTHFNLAQALDVVARVRPERALLTHICHDLPHAATSKRLPPGVEIAHDGLVIGIEGTQSNESRVTSHEKESRGCG
jgi:phosphoribosyl 1,2-cyclic phosphate phosphodiesterase